MYPFIYNRHMIINYLNKKYFNNKNLLYSTYNFPTPPPNNNILIYLIGITIIIWSLHDIVYIFDKENKNISYNVLDLISKCFVGLWIYFTKTIV